MPRQARERSESGIYHLMLREKSDKEGVRE